MITKNDIDRAMTHAVDIADRASTPFGSALLDKDGNIILDAVNTSAADGPLAHAEMNLLHRAIEMKLPLQEMCLVSTCEPCPMCMGAILWSKVSQCAYGVSIATAAKYMKQIHINARDIATSGLVNVKLIEEQHSEKVIPLFEKYA